MELRKNCVCSFSAKKLLSRIAKLARNHEKKYVFDEVVGISKPCPNFGTAERMAITVYLLELFFGKEMYKYYVSTVLTSRIFHIF